MIISNILIIDPDIRSREILERNLISRNILSVSCGRGREAFSLIFRHRPSLVIMELNLPDIGGFKLARRLRTMSAAADLPILALTAAPERLSAERALRSGFNGYLAKSEISISGIIETIIGQLGLIKSVN